MPQRRPLDEAATSGRIESMLPAERRRQSATAFVTRGRGAPLGDSEATAAAAGSIDYRRVEQLAARVVHTHEVAGSSPAPASG